MGYCESIALHGLTQHLILQWQRFTLFLNIVHLEGSYSHKELNNIEQPHWIKVPTRQDILERERGSLIIIYTLFSMIRSENCKHARHRFCPGRCKKKRRTHSVLRSTSDSSSLTATEVRPFVDASLACEAQQDSTDLDVCHRRFGLIRLGLLTVLEWTEHNYLRG